MLARGQLWLVPQQLWLCCSKVTAPGSCSLGTAKLQSPALWRWLSSLCWRQEHREDTAVKALLKAGSQGEFSKGCGNLAHGIPWSHLLPST